MAGQILTPEQAAKILQIHPMTILKYIKQGKLRGSKLGRVYRIKEEDLYKFLDDNSTK